MDSSTVPKNVFDVIECYKKFCHKPELSALDMMINQCAVAGWKPSLVSHDNQVPTEQAHLLLKKLPVRKLKELLVVVKKGCILLNLKQGDTNKYCNRAEILIEFCVVEKWLSDKNSTETLSKNMPGAERYTLQPKDREYTSSFSSSGVKRSPEIGLGTQSKDFIIDDPRFKVEDFIFFYYLAVKSIFQVTNLFNLFVFEHVLGNKKLQKELERLEDKFSKSKSLNQLLYKTFHLLGYAHRIKEVPLQELRLTSIVPFVKLKYFESDFANDHDFELKADGSYKHLNRVSQKLSSSEAIAERRILKQSQDMIGQLECYFEWLDQSRIKGGAKDGLADASKSRAIDFVIDIANCLYDLDRKTEAYKNHLIVQKLKELRNKYLPNSNHQKARVEVRCLKWEQATEVAEKQREKSDIRYRTPSRDHNSGRMLPSKRDASAIASDLQRTIILLLLLLIPSDRQQTYRRIQFRESLRLKEQTDGVFLICGDIINDVLQPRAKLKDFSKAQWWLAVYEFKTDNTYDDPFWYPLPNQEFADGKVFYEYLEMWWFGLDDKKGKWANYYEDENFNWQGFIDKAGNKHGWRAALKPEHDYFFSMSTARTPFTDVAFRDLVKTVFIRFTPEIVGKVVAVTPHSFRTMLATHTDGQLTLPEEKSMAYCEHHSVEVRRARYTFLDNMKKIAPAIQVMERVNKELFLEGSREEVSTEENPSSTKSSLPIEKPTTIFDILEKFDEENRKDSSMIRTAIERFAVAGWGGPIVNKRKKVTFETREFLKQVPAHRIKNIIEAVKQGCDLLKYSLRDKSKYCSYAKTLLEFCKKKGWLSTPHSQLSSLKTSETKESDTQPTSQKFRKGYVSSTGINRSLRIGLGMVDSDYVNVEGEQMLGSLHLQGELDELEKYIDKLVEKKTLENLLHRILRLLGYLHRVQKIPLADLSINKLIPFVKLRYFEEDLKTDNIHSEFECLRIDTNYADSNAWETESKLAQLENIAKRRAECEAENVSKFAENYLNWSDRDRISAGAVGGLANSSKQSTFDALVMVAKYVYRSETAFSSSFVDISIITKLRDDRKKLPRNARQQKARVAKRCITWEEVIEVEEMQRKAADQRRFRRETGKHSRDKRLTQSIAKDIQKLLVLLFLILIPSDRQQTFRRLQYRESIRVREQVEGVFLLFGDFVDNEFTHRSKLKNPQQARWWLAVYEFKEIENYGPFWYPLPNQEFADGKAFYEYLEMWLFGLNDTEGKWESYYKGENACWQGYVDDRGHRHGWRDALKPNDHNYFFSCPISKKSYDDGESGGFTNLIKKIFIRFTPQLQRDEVVPVTPHSFRTMLISYTEGKLSGEEESSMAYCEHHSVETRRGPYTLSNNMVQITAARKVMERINNALFLSPETKC